MNSRPSDYNAARVTLSTSRWLDPLTVVTYLRRVTCADPSGLGYWDLTLQERAILERLALRANSDWVSIATLDDLAVAGVGKNAAAPAVSSLAERGYLRQLHGPGGARLFVLLEKSPTARPGDWTPSGLHRSARAHEPRPGTFRPATRKAPTPEERAATREAERAQLVERLDRLAHKDACLTVMSAARAQRQRALTVPQARMFVDAFERAERECDVVAVKQALERVAEAGIPEGEPRRWAPYFLRVCQGMQKDRRRRISPAESKAADASAVVIALLGQAAAANHDGDRETAEAMWPTIAEAARAAASVFEGLHPDPEARALELALTAWCRGTDEWRSAEQVITPWKFAAPAISY